MNAKNISGSKAKHKLSQFYAWALLAIIISSCSSNNYEPQEPDAAPIIVGVSSTPALSWKPGSRAADGAPVDAELPASIGVFGFNNGRDYGQVFLNWPMYHWPNHVGNSPVTGTDDWPTENDWPYAERKYWLKTCDYRFFAYAPYNPDQSTAIKFFHNSYDAVESFSHLRIPPISNVDYLVANKLVEVHTGTSPEFHMVHVASRLRFCFALGERYSKLRDIYLRKISISDVAEGKRFFYRCDVTMVKGGQVLDPAEITLSQTDVEYTVTGNGMIDLIPDYTNNGSGKQGMLVPYQGDGGYENFASAYNTMTYLDNPRLTIVYDVYDKAGQCLREGETTSFTVDLSSLPAFVPGYYYDVRLLITPDYLYVLSDNDVPAHAIVNVKE